MAERIVQEESLTTVADAIRAKGGTSDPLSFPDGFKTAIEAIQAGSGGVKMEIGSFKLTESINITHPNYYQVQHSLGVLPKYVICYQNDNYPTKTYSTLICDIITRVSDTSTDFRSICVNTHPSNNNFFQIQNSVLTSDEYRPTDTNFKVGFLGTTLSSNLAPNVEYVWIAIA